MLYAISLLLCSVFFAFRFYLTKTLVCLVSCFLPLVIVLIACFAPSKLFRVLAALTFLTVGGYNLYCYLTTVIPDVTYLFTTIIWGALAIHSLVVSLEEPANEPCKTSV